MSSLAPVRMADAPAGAASPMDQALAVFSKDLRAELRNRTATSSILLFSITALVVVGFALPSKGLTPAIHAALLWVILFFAAFSGLSHVFVHEEEAGTTMALRLTAATGAVFAGKLLANLLLLLLIVLVDVPLFVLLLQVDLPRPMHFISVVLTGGIGLGAAATIVAAIIAKARGKGALYGALGFPILLPLLFMAVDATTAALNDRIPIARLTRDLIGLGAFAVMLVTASALLFPFVWED